MGKYKCIVADPPWAYRDKRAYKGAGQGLDTHYEQVDLEKLKAFPINDVAHKNCFLFVWSVSPQPQEALELVNAWGFKYVSKLYWIKGNSTTQGMKFGPAMGRYWRGGVEEVLVCKRGKPKMPNTIHDMNVIFEKSRGHSSKPEALQNRIHHREFEGPYLELFARRERKGWDCWGNELEGSDKKLGVSYEWWK